MLAGLSPGAHAYVSYAALRALPQVSVYLDHDENFAGYARGLQATGVPLDVLAKALGTVPGSDLIDALCTDDYRAHYPASYIAAHHPLLALTIDREAPAVWAAHVHAEDPGPYFITHAHFVPAFHILAHVDEAQVPTNVIRLNFGSVAQTYGSLAPRGLHAQDAAVQQGFGIAKQNCLRCHFQGAYGGTKSGRSWSALSTWAREQPAYFAGYIHDPQAFEPHAHMPANPAYDKPTLAALTAYFASLALVDQKAAGSAK